MNCKNCNENLVNHENYCPDCGAEVIEYRIDAKRMFYDFSSNFIGWDNKYLVTIKTLIISPDVLFKSYLDGTRKKYVPPFVFFAIGMAISLLVFNQFTEEYLDMSAQMTESQMELIDDTVGTEDSTNANENSKNTNDLDGTNDSKERQLQSSADFQKNMLKNYNLFAFMLLPFYTLIAFLVFRKPYNFGEHLVINAYIQGFTFLVTVLFFIFSLFIDPSFYFYSLPVLIVYYLYAYKKLYHLTIGKTILKFLRFILVILVLALIIMVISFIIGVLVSYLKSR